MEAKLKMRCSFGMMMMLLLWNFVAVEGKKVSQAIRESMQIIMASSS